MQNRVLTISWFAPLAMLLGDIASCVGQGSPQKDIGYRCIEVSGQTRSEPAYNSLLNIYTHWSRRLLSCHLNIYRDSQSFVSDIIIIA